MIRPLKRQKTTDNSSNNNNDDNNTRTNQLPKFLSFLRQNNAVIHPNVSFLQSKSWGLHVLANQPIPAYEPIFQLPLQLCITYATTQHDATFNSLLTAAQKSSFLDVEWERACVYIYLLYQRHLGTTSTWNEYIHILPTIDELESRIATCYTPATNATNATIATNALQTNLMNTWIGQKIIPKHIQLLDRIHTNICIPIEKHLNNPNIFTRKQLTWSAGIFHSRAIMVPNIHNKSSNQRIEAIVPLIDILNHRPGYLSELQRRSTFSSSSTTFSTTSSTTTSIPSNEMMEYKVGRTISKDSQIFLNYGPKANEDLLSHFGFALNNNICDVLHLQLTSTSNEIGLYEGCHLKQILDECREAVATEKKKSQKDDVDGERRIDGVYDKTAGIGDSNGDSTGDDDNASVAETSSSSATWFAQMMKEEKEGNKNNTIDMSITNIGTPRNKRNEQLALEKLEHILLEYVDDKVAVIGTSGAVVDTSAVVDTCSSITTEIKEDVEIYKNGLKRVAKTILIRVRQLKEQLKKR